MHYLPHHLCEYFAGPLGGPIGNFYQKEVQYILFAPQLGPEILTVHAIVQTLLRIFSSITVLSKMNIQEDI